MAPTLRNASATGVGKKVHRKRVARKEPSDTWAMDTDMHDGDAHMDFQDQDDSPALDSPVDIDAAVGPLREMAERVGKEVETFAETLDDFFNDLPTAPSNFDAAYDLVTKFKDIADSTVAQMKERHERELRAQLRHEWGEHARISATSTAMRPFAATTSSALSAQKTRQLSELRLWQQEADLWDLFRMMLELHPFDSDKQALQADKEAKLARLGPPHRYTSEADLWERFIAEDDLAKERNKIKEWLERTADHQKSDLQGIMEELEAKAGRGKGLWSSGWMHTRERIKGEKRIRSWPNAADAPLPQIRRSDNNELLSTTLDPDAPIRQQRTLEKSDAYFERAMWIACWEMLRRGIPWQEICEWCEERKEGWRAVCMGKAMDNTEPGASTATWRRMCRLASQSPSATEYEAAVFALLGGNVNQVQKVSQRVDDNLYAYYNGILLQQFDNYVLSICPDKAPPQQWRRSVVDDSLRDPQQAEQTIKELINRLRQGPTTAGEATEPLKIIQSYLLADEVGSLIHTVGSAVADTAAQQGPENMIFLADRKPRATDGVYLPESEVAAHTQALRMAAHMSIIYRILSPDYLSSLEGDEQLEDENVIVAYIQALRAAGKRDCIPIYASRLQRERYIVVLGRVLQDVTDEQEQSRLLDLLQQYDLDVTPVIKEQLSWVVDHNLTGDYKRQPLQILEPTEETKLHPGQRIIVGFLPDDMEPEDEAVVRCLKWFYQMRGGWKAMYEALSTTLIRCLVTGRFTCARMITSNFPYAEISLRKTHEELGHSINLMETDVEPSDEEEELRLELMKRQSRTYYELTQLVHAIECLGLWRIEENKYVSKAQKPSTVPPALKLALKNVITAMAPLLSGILQQPEGEDEARDLAHIRIAYLPEAVIAHNTVLHAAGNLITRDYLLESMELSVAVAGDTDDRETNGLEECFVRAGRMRELVTSFALTSKVMLVLKAEGKPWKAKRDRVGRDLGMWEISSHVAGVGDE